MSRPPTISALLIVAHGDGGAARLNTNVRRLGAELAAALNLPVAYALLKEPETFERARVDLAEAADGRVLVLPLFMSEGYFVRVKMQQLLAANGFATVERLAPLGLWESLVDLLGHRLEALAASSGGRTADQMRILMVAHGSRSGEPASRLRAEAVAATLSARGLGTIHLAFIEEPPSVADQLAAVDPEIVVGFFASEGTHALDDVKALVDARPQVRHHVTAIGIDEGIAPMIAAAVRHRIERSRMAALPEKG